MDIRRATSVLGIFIQYNSWKKNSESKPTYSPFTAIMVNLSCQGIQSQPVVAETANDVVKKEAHFWHVLDEESEPIG